jgi:hypothetical protein
VALRSRRVRIVSTEIVRARLRQRNAIGKFENAGKATTQEGPGMFDFYRHFHWFLKVHRYDNQEQLIADLSERVILLAEMKVQELRHLQRELTNAVSSA